MSIFEKIINGEINSHKIYEDDFIFAFLDVNPKSRGHFLVVPKVKSTNLMDIKSNDRMILFDKAISLANKVKEILGCDGYKLQVNNSSASGQEVFYTHIHIIPSECQIDSSLDIIAN